MASMWTIGALAGAALLAGCASLDGAPAGDASRLSGGCTRADLEGAVDAYLAAQRAGDPSRAGLVASGGYIENRAPADLETGILARPLDIAFHRSVYDTEPCETFTEMVDPNPDAPYVLGVHLTVKDRRLAEIDTLVTTTGSWLFNAPNFLLWASEENWEPIPEDERDSRATLIAAGKAYFDRFLSDDVVVPFGVPCRRLEGGARTGNGSPDDSCEVGLGGGFDIQDRHYLADPTIGAAVVLAPFTEGGPPDSHMFRVVKGKIRWVHTMTGCNPDERECIQARPAGPGGREQN